MRMEGNEGGNKASISPPDAVVPNHPSAVAEAPAPAPVLTLLVTARGCWLWKYVTSCLSSGCCVSASKCWMRRRSSNSRTEGKETEEKRKQTGCKEMEEHKRKGRRDGEEKLRL